MSETPERMLSWKQVRPLVGDIGRTTAWRMEQAGTFPPSYVMSSGRRAWRERDIAAWQRHRVPQGPAWEPPQ